MSSDVDPYLDPDSDPVRSAFISVYGSGSRSRGIE